MPNGQTLEDYISEKIEQGFNDHLAKALAEGLEINVQGPFINVRYNGTIVAWDTLPQKD